MDVKFTIPQMQDYLAEIFPQLGGAVTIEEMRPHFVRTRLRTDESHLRPGGTISGPTMFMLADCTFYIAVLAMLGREALAVTTNANIDFLRKPAPGDLVAEGRILKLGRVLIVGDVLIKSPSLDGPVARASLTYSVPPKPVT